MNSILAELRSQILFFFTKGYQNADEHILCLG